MRYSLFYLLLLTSLSQGLPGDEGWQRAIAVGDGDVRVVYPESLDVDLRRVQLLLEAVLNQRSIPGLPEETLSMRITVSLAPKPQEGFDGWSSAVDALIVLPSEKSSNWSANKLMRVIRHELAHIAMGTYLEYRSTPAWLREGFAEWATGGLTCAARQRIALDLEIRERNGLPPASLFALPARDRVSYDYFASALEFIEDTTAGGITDGSFMAAIREYGVGNLFAKYGGRAAFERAWQTSLQETLSLPQPAGDCHE